MIKDKKSPEVKFPIVRILFFIFGAIVLLFTVFLGSSIYFFEKNYADKIYPGVLIDGVLFGGKTPDEVENYFTQKSLVFSKLQINLVFEDKIATLSSQDLNISYDGKLAGAQGFFIGRSRNFLSNIYQKSQAAYVGINLPSILIFNTDNVNDVLSRLSTAIDIPAEDALFQFENGKVNSFKLSRPGRALNTVQSKEIVLSYIKSLGKNGNINSPIVTLPLTVDTILPKITTENSNNFGIKELLGVGTSKFMGSIPGRVHNIELAASKINGHLVPPGTTFSFNDTLGDVSATTGFQPAYIIKEGRTVLGDGGGVCQVSTTLFRAALHSGLPIVERNAHAYRVSYYEQDSGPGMDATVFAPGYDLKFKNDTPNYLLIQAKTDTSNYALTFEIYGTGDGRKAEVSKPVILSQSPPPPDLHQDDPVLPKGTVKQVDWAAWGAKVNFDYKVTRNGEVLQQQSFFSNFKPWQAVFLHGTKE